MQLLYESLKNNFNALQYCIQYEVLQRKPVFESYRSFCKAVGSDVMDYQEFEFWYMRFYNDQLDLDYDKKQDPEPLTLLELPVEVVDKVMKNLDPIEKIVFVRQVCKPIQNITEPITLENIDVSVEEIEQPFELISSTIQWKQAKTVDLKPDEEGLSAMNLRDFFHFSDFSVDLSEISRDLLTDLKNNILTFDGFKKCEIYTYFDIDTIKSVFGMEIEWNQPFFMPIPGSRDELKIHARTHDPCNLLLQRV